MPIEHVIAIDSLLRKLSMRFIVFLVVVAVLASGCSTGSKVCLYNNSSSGVAVVWGAGSDVGRLNLGVGQMKCIDDLRTFFEFDILVTYEGHEHVFSVNAQENNYWVIGSIFELKRRIHRIQINENGFLFYVKSEEKFPVIIDDAMDVNKVYHVRSRSLH